MSSSPLDSPPAPRPSRPPRIARIARSTPGVRPARLARFAILAGVAPALLVPLLLERRGWLSSTRAVASNCAARPALRHVAAPLLPYGVLMVHEATQGVPVETRAIALFATGIPLFCAGCGLARWHGERAAAPRGEPA
ncbi:hypothetical protein [Massilia sp. YIM B02443]|uniref:hypothetical protein n=1 Tax=Massilia sp. YIM B02443 TaxID=3050127 RepID=UPI0025B65DCC|nr:hypothetical protein [Massilia sp. YIM B02443]MDN4039504.1 hypothetical protein [Massilia sp. YIM B02443]